MEHELQKDKPSAGGGVPLAIALSPHRRLRLEPDTGGNALESSLADRLSRAFERGAGHGLLLLGAGETGAILPPALGYWRDFAARFVASLCARVDEGAQAATLSFPAPPDDLVEEYASAAPPMVGAEYLDAGVLRDMWQEMSAALREELAESGTGLQDFLKARNPAWNLVGRVHFHLAENRRDEGMPFAFLATYTTGLSSGGQATHLPLGEALKEYSGAAKRGRLLSLLLPVQRASQECPWLKAMVDDGDIFHPIRWSPSDALRFLQDIPKLEAAGVVVRTPAAWKAGRPARPMASATIGSRAPAGLGVEAILDFRVDVALDGEQLTQAEIERLLAATSGLELIRGKWVEVDGEKLRAMLERFRQAQGAAAEGRFTFAEAMRMLAGANLEDEEPAVANGRDWSQVIAGPWLRETLNGLRHPEVQKGTGPGKDIKAELRPYQRAGTRWLHLLSSLGLGACLADDMGLGKTMQILALLSVIKRLEGGTHGPSLLVAPASLLANWALEGKRFAPGLKMLTAHGSATDGEMNAEVLRADSPPDLRGVDLVLTSYGSLLRNPWLAKVPWRLVVLDEAQAIKNPGAKQTKAAKKLEAKARIALTGTPIENRLKDLWSIFDFLNPGLLGTAKEFDATAKRLSKRPHNPFAPLRDLVRPYILRRMKTDKNVIADLPEKTEVTAFCSLSRKQAALYSKAVEDLASQISGAEGIKRKGVVLSSLVRLKQICNHPSQWLGDGRWSEEDSGKWGRLRLIAEVLASRQEKALVFTQFREVAAPIAAFLGGIFGRPGLILHGQTPVKERARLVARFQEDETVPFLVLSLKVGGTGLNLTAASHVIHFDRWWNPAVEAQATDRAFRIGQKKNILVHKFLCRGTVEEKIDAMINSKRQLSRDLLEGGTEQMLTEMADDDLLELVALDLKTALREE
jgi:non-specific serine/threonine protein kinase